MAILADYRSDLSNLLATAVDASTWPTTLLDEALRRALNELNLLLVYETNFTVAIAGYEQDLSSLPNLYSVLALAYPWQEGRDFAHYLATWRIVGPSKVYFTTVQPTVGEVVRVRHCKMHTIDDLDGAATTTVPESHRALISLWAAAYACELRHRQISENPALPKDAGQHLVKLAEIFRRRVQEAISHLPPLGRLRWGNLGLE